MIDKNKVYEATYETIKESLEWGLGEKDYGQFIDGVIAMTEKLLDKFTIFPHITTATGYVGIEK